MRSQMKKRLRAEAYASYIKMGQANYNVDPQLYELVRKRRADSNLCGRFACDSAELPPMVNRTMRTKNRHRCVAFPIDDSTVEEIVAEELPSAKVWHRFLIRWRGYDPAWEAWRIPGRGTVGDPVESWELAASLVGTQALARWKASN